MNYGVNLAEISLVEMNGKFGWGTSGKEAKQIIPAEGKPGEIDIAYLDITLSLKQSDLMNGIPVKLGAICYLLLTLIKQKAPSQLFR